MSFIDCLVMNPQLAVDEHVIQTFEAALTQCPEIDPISSVSDVAMYSRLFAWWLQHRPLSPQVPALFRPLMIETAKYLYDGELGPNGHLIAQASLHFEKPILTIENVSAYIREVVFDLMDNGQWTYEHIGELEHWLGTYLDLPTPPWQSPRDHLGGVTLGQTLQTNMECTAMYLSHWLIKYGARIAKASPIMNRLVSLTLQKILNEKRGFIAEIVSDPSKYGVEDVLQFVYQGRKRSDAARRSKRYAIQADFSSPQDLVPTKSSEWISKTVEQALNSVEEWTPVSRRQNRRAIDALEEYCAQPSPAPDPAKLKSIFIGDTPVTTFLLKDPQQLLKSMVDWFIAHPEVSRGTFLGTIIFTSVAKALNDVSEWTPKLIRETTRTMKLLNAFCKTRNPDPDRLKAIVIGDNPVTPVMLHNPRLLLSSLLIWLKAHPEVRVSTGRQSDEPPDPEG
jgi:hypothetical protein